MTIIRLDAVGAINYPQRCNYQGSIYRGIYNLCWIQFLTLAENDFDDWIDLMAMFFKLVFS